MGAMYHKMITVHGENEKMGDYISRQAAIRALIDAITPKRDGNTVTVNIMSEQMIATTINSLPSADVVEVVRCADCKHSYETFVGLVCSHGVCVDCVVRDDFYCAYGEPKNVTASEQS